MAAVLTTNYRYACIQGQYMLLDLPINATSKVSESSDELSITGTHFTASEGTKKKVCNCQEASACLKTNLMPKIGINILNIIMLAIYPRNRLSGVIYEIYWT
jgi:hypothetical protein